MSKLGKLRFSQRIKRRQAIVGSTLLRRALGRSVEKHGKFVPPDLQIAALVLEILETEIEAEATKAEVQSIKNSLRTVLGLPVDATAEINAA